MLRLPRTLPIPHHLKHFTNSSCFTVSHKVGPVHTLEYLWGSSLLLMWSQSLHLPVPSPFVGPLISFSVVYVKVVTSWLSLLGITAGQINMVIYISSPSGPTGPHVGCPQVKFFPVHLTCCMDLEINQGFFFLFWR